MCGSENRHTTPRVTDGEHSLNAKTIENLKEHLCTIFKRPVLDDSLFTATMPRHINRDSGAILNVTDMIVPHVMVKVHTMQKDDWHSITRDTPHVHSYASNRRFDVVLLQSHVMLHRGGAGTIAAIAFAYLTRTFSYDRSRSIFM